MQMQSLQDLFVDQLKDLYSAETQLIKALPKMAKAASSPQLKSAFNEHLEQTNNQVQRLEKIFQQLSVSARGKKCKGMEGLIEECADQIKEDATPEVMDAGLIAAAQRVEHYEIAGYGCVRTFARTLQNDDASRLLQQTLKEESETDQKLTDLAEKMINIQAQSHAPNERGEYQTGA